MAAYNVGVYRTNDSLSNFKIRVCLEKRSSTRFGYGQGPSSSGVSSVRRVEEDPQNGMELRDFSVPQSPGTEPIIETDEYTFSWQEKIFSKSECVLYSNENNCHNPQQTKYHEMIRNLKDKKKPTKWLFTYVDGDETPNKQTTVFGGLDNETTKTVLASNVDTLRRRKSSLKPSWNQEGVRDFSHINVVNQNPTETQRKLWHNVTTPFQTMYVMAELQSENGAEEEVVMLCTVKADERGVLYVEPDFRQKSYELEIRDLGKDWVYEGGDHPIYGSTQTSKAKVVDGCREISYFGHTFAHLMSCKTNQIFHNDSPTKWPQLLIQVMSRDVWNRFRTEGYGYVTVPSQPGCHTFEISTWRPLTPNTVNDQLRRFFIGGSPELEELTDVADTVLSKYGFRTITTGTVTIRFQTVHQSEQFLLNESKRNQNKFVNFKPSSMLQTSVEAVLEAFHRARHRMLAARENLNF